MKPTTLFILVISAVLFGCTRDNQLSVSEFKNLQSGFNIPADTNKVWCYWYWLNDDISKEGVTKDLEAMKAAGIGGAFIGNINPDEKDGPVPLFSELWWETMVHAVTEGKRLGVDIGVFNCPGWSQSGGPWVKPDMAMRHLVYSETRVTGGSKIGVTLPKPADLFQDVYVLAIPREESKYKTIHWPDAGGIETNTGKSFEFDCFTPPPFKAHTLVLYPSNTPLRADCELLAWQNGEYKTIRTFVYDRSNAALNVGPDPMGPVTIALPGVEAGKFRLIVRNPSGGGPKSGFAGITLTEEVLLEKYVEKQLGKMHPDPFPAWGTYLWDLQNNGEAGKSGIGTDQVTDVSRFMDAGGNLSWDAPAGEWTLLRFGMTPTGTQNSPAAPQGKGYEIDKANRKLIEFHFTNYVGELLKRIPDGSRSALKYVIADSYEMGSQNWTDGYAEIFARRYGYDPMEYFPVLTGRIVGSVEESERFLWDLRRAVADDVAYEYVGGLRKISNDNNLKIWLENYGHWGFPSEFLMYGGQSDLVGGEFWNEGTLGNIECKAASSSAHTYGKPVTSAEAFTASGNAYLRSPAQLKRRGDWAYTEGINHFVVHVYIHQPDDQRNPGVNAWFSTEFNRHNTWFSLSKSWFDYLRRCQHMLQQGKYAADVCYFIGEDAPKMTGARIPELPAGYSYDYINAEVILSRLSVKEGRLVLPDGMSYGMMVLPPLKTMRPELLEKIRSLVEAGAVILGPKPDSSPSLQGFPGCDDKVRKLAGELWGPEASAKIHPFGKGLVLNNMGTKEALEQINLSEDFFAGGDYPVLWTHRTKPGLDIWFLTNQGKEPVTFEPSFRVEGKQPQLWDAVTGSIRLLKEFRVEDGRTRVPLTLEPGQSYFVVFSDRKTGISDEGFMANFEEMRTLSEIKGPWRLDFANKVIGPSAPVQLDSLMDLARMEPENIRYYSGTVTYTAEFTLDPVPEGKSLYLDLGSVGVMARVKINGSDAGTLWMYPWTLNISKLIKQGANTIEIEVANLWRNRLIYDSRLSKEQRYTWTIVSDIRQDEIPPPSGLIGPVRIVTRDAKHDLCP